MQYPIIILASSPRTGSTWLQRQYIKEGINLYGETQYYLRQMLDYEHMGRSLKNEWTACTAPDLEKMFQGLRLFFNHVYGDKWGTKEVIWNEKFRRAIKKIYPNCKIVYLFRKFMDSFKSRYGPAYSVQKNAHLLYPYKHTGRDQDIKDFCELWINQVSLMLGNNIVNYDNIKNYKGYHPELQIQIKKLDYVGGSNRIWDPTPDMPILEMFLPKIKQLEEEASKTFV